MCMQQSSGQPTGSSNSASVVDKSTWSPSDGLASASANNEGSPMRSVDTDTHDASLPGSPDTVLPPLDHPTDEPSKAEPSVKLSSSTDFTDVRDSGRASYPTSPLSKPSTIVKPSIATARPAVSSDTLEYNVPQVRHADTSGAGCYFLSACASRLCTPKLTGEALIS